MASCGFELNRGAFELNGAASNILTPESCPISSLYLPLPLLISSPPSMSSSASVVASAAPHFITLFLLPYTLVLLILPHPVSQSSVAAHHSYFHRSIFVVTLVPVALYIVGAISGLLDISKVPDSAPPFSKRSNWKYALDIQEALGQLGASLAVLYLMYRYGPRHRLASAGLSGVLSCGFIATVLVFCLAGFSLTSVNIARPSARISVSASAVVWVSAVLQLASFVVLGFLKREVGFARSRPPGSTSLSARPFSEHSRMHLAAKPSQSTLRPSHRAVSPASGSTELSIPPPRLRIPRGQVPPPPVFSSTIDKLMLRIVAAQTFEVVGGLLGMVDAILTADGQEARSLHYTFSVLVSVFHVVWLSGILQVYYALCTPRLVTVDAERGRPVYAPSLTINPVTLSRHVVAPARTSSLTISPTTAIFGVTPTPTVIATVSEEFLAQATDDPFSSPPPGTLPAHVNSRTRRRPRTSTSTEDMGSDPGHTNTEESVPPVPRIPAELVRKARKRVKSDAGSKDSSGSSRRNRSYRVAAVRSSLTSIVSRKRRSGGVITQEPQPETRSRPSRLPIPEQYRTPRNSGEMDRAFAEEVRVLSPLIHGEDGSQDPGPSSSKSLGIIVSPSKSRSPRKATSSSRQQSIVSSTTFGNERNSTSVEDGPAATRTQAEQLLGSVISNALSLRQETKNLGPSGEVNPRPGSGSGTVTPTPIRSPTRTPRQSLTRNEPAASRSPIETVANPALQLFEEYRNQVYRDMPPTVEDHQFLSSDGASGSVASPLASPPHLAPNVAPIDMPHYAPTHFSSPSLPPTPALERAERLAWRAGIDSTLIEIERPDTPTIVPSSAPIDIPGREELSPFQIRNRFFPGIESSDSEARTASSEAGSGSGPSLTRRVTIGGSVDPGPHRPRNYTRVMRQRREAAGTSSFGRPRNNPPSKFSDTSESDTLDSVEEDSPPQPPMDRSEAGRPARRSTMN